MTDHQFKTIECERQDAVLTIRLACPPVNPMNQVMFTEIRKAFEGPATAPDVRAVVLSSSGRHFSAGGDVEDLRSIGSGAETKLKVIRESFWAVMDCPVPVVGAVQGKALGGGAALVSLCDFIYCEPKTELGLPELHVGVMGGAGHLMRILPQPVVRHMFLTGAPIGAEELVAHGAAKAVVAREELEQTAHAAAEEMTALSSIALRFAKRDLAIAEQSQLKQRYELEQMLTRELGNYADSREAATAFLEQRAPKYRHDQLLRQEPVGEGSR